MGYWDCLSGEIARHRIVTPGSGLRSVHRASFGPRCSLTAPEPKKSVFNVRKLP